MRVKNVPTESVFERRQKLILWSSFRFQNTVQKRYFLVIMHVKTVPNESAFEPRRKLILWSSIRLKKWYVTDPCRELRVLTIPVKSVFEPRHKLNPLSTIRLKNHGTSRILFQR